MRRRGGQRSRQSVFHLTVGFIIYGMESPFDDPEAKQWLDSVERDMLPKMKESTLSLTIFSGTIDAKLCVEFGAAILLDKPLILVVLDGQAIPAALERAADAIIRGKMSDPDIQERITEAIQLALIKHQK